jgi:hypothetical protein
MALIVVEHHNSFENYSSLFYHHKDLDDEKL